MAEDPRRQREDEPGATGERDEATGEEDTPPAPGITGAASGGPLTGIAVSGPGGRLPADGEPAGIRPTGGEDLPPGAGRPGPRGPDSPAAADIGLTDTDASTAGVTAARKRIVEQGEAASGGAEGRTPD